MISAISCTNQDKKELVKVKLATSKNMWCGLTIIAGEKKYFEEEGLDITLNYLEAGRYCMDAVVSKSAQFGNVVEVNVAYIGFTGNSNYQIIGSIVSSTSSAIVAKRSRGINKPEDLKGKILALSPGTTSDVFAHRFLTKYGIDKNDISIRKIQPLAMQTAILDKNGIDAASTWDPFAYNMKKMLGNDAIEFTAADVYTGYECIAVQKEWAQNNKTVVYAFLRAIKKAEIFLNQYPAEAQTIISRNINLDPEIVKGTWDKHNFKLSLNEKELIKSIQLIGNSVIDNDDSYKGKSLPDYQMVFDTTYLKEALK